MFTQYAIIQALKEKKKNYSELYTRTREILKEYQMKIVKQQFTDSLKPMIQSGVITKKKTTNQTGNPVIYSISNGDHAQNQAQLILDIGDAMNLVDNFTNILNECEGAFQNIENSLEKNKSTLYAELNENLVLVSEVLSPMIAKMILYQNKSIENLYVIKEIRRIERLARKLFDQAGELSKKLGKKNHDEFINTFDHNFTKELSSKYQKLLRDNTMFSKS